MSNKLDSNDDNDAYKLPILKSLSIPACIKFLDAYDNYFNCHNHLTDEDRRKFLAKMRLSKLVVKSIWDEIKGRKLYHLVKELCQKKRNKLLITRNMQCNY